MKIVIIDYGMGNLRSVQKKFERLKINPTISSDLKMIESADKLILPGVGHFKNGVEKLQEYNLWDLLNEKVLIKQTPVLGICLGMQLMGGNSEEGNVTGLKWFDAKVIKFKISDKLKYKVPHMGWNQAIKRRDNILFQNITNTDSFYFVHSYHIVCNNQEDILAETTYEYTFTSAIQKDYIFGTQFHPEKSHDWGETVFRNFANI